MRELSRIITRDIPLARDLAANLLETADRLSVGRDTGQVAAAPAVPTPPLTTPLPARPTASPTPGVAK